MTKTRTIYLLTIVLLICVMRAVAHENRFYVYNAANGLADNSAQTIHCTKTGRLVITTMGQINFFDGQKFTYIDPTTENTYPLSKYNGHAHLFFDKHHHLWLKKRHSLSCVNLTREMYADNIVDEFQELGINDDVQDFFVDNSNGVWVLTEEGLYCAETQGKYDVRPNSNLQDLQTYQDKYLLLFYEDGQLDIQELATGATVYSEKAYSEKVAARYRNTSYVNEIGSLFYQIRNGDQQAILMCFDIGKWKWETILETPYYMSSIVEHDSLIYIPTAYGYWTYNPATGEKEHVEQLMMSNGQTLLTDINAMAFDLQGGLWVGTEKRGLLYSRPIASPFHVYEWTDARATELAIMMDQQITVRDKYHDKTVNCVFRDSRGWDWVGTSAGLQLYRSQTDKLPQVITRRDGLLNNVIHTIIEDGSHNIWVGTSFGICCLKIENGKLRYINSYNQWDNIPSESFVNGRAIRLSDGTIGMQMLDHVIEFNPDKMVTITKGVSFEIHPKLIKLLVNGNDIKTGQELDGHIILERALTRTKEINLNYNQNSVSMTFSALNYFRPQQTYYRVRVGGPDVPWRVMTPYNSGGLVDGQGLLHLPLVALTPGSYSIEVQTSMIPDQWDDEPYEWIININEPWWRTTGIFALLGVVLLTLFLVNVYFYVRNAGMYARRSNEEQGVIRRIKLFADKCFAEYHGELLEPTPDEISGLGSESTNSLSPEFIDMMVKILETVKETKTSQLSMKMLSEKAGMDLQQFYTLVASNIYKNPRALFKRMMLKRAERLLIDTGKDMEEIATECNFESPNYLIAAFYHENRMLPEEFRRKNRSF